MNSFSALSLVALAASASHASIVTASGDAAVITPPASVQTNSLTSDDVLFAFREGASVTLDTAFPLDQTAAGITDDGGDLVSGQIDAGTAFNSYYLHADPSTSAQDYIGSFTFGQPILGVVLRTSTLDETDPIVGFSGTAYPTGASLRDIEFGTQDEFTISDDRLTFSFDIGVGVSIDSLRVITEVPAPGSAFGAMIGFGVAMRRRRVRA